MYGNIRQWFPKFSAGPDFLFPNEVAGLEIWYDVSDAGTITKDGSNNVSQIDDKSSNLYHVTEGTLGNQPTWVANQFKGFDVVRFNSASAKRLKTGNVVNALDFFLVAKPTSQITMIALSGGGTAVYYQLRYIDSTSAADFVTRNSVAFSLSDIPVIDPDGGSIWNFNNNPITNLANLFTSQSASQTTTATAHSSPRVFSLNYRSSFSEYGNFDFLECFAFNNVVSDDNRVKLWQYLSNKYSLTKPTL